MIKESNLHTLQTTLTLNINYQKEVKINMQK
jgi:hypothetical protein